MPVTVRLHGGLERYAGGAGPFRMALAEGATLLDLQDILQIPRGEVGLFVVDGELCDEGKHPRAAAKIDLYPVFGGG